MRSSSYVVIERRKNTKLLCGNINQTCYDVKQIGKENNEMLSLNKNIIVDQNMNSINFV